MQKAVDKSRKGTARRCQGDVEIHARSVGPCIIGMFLAVFFVIISGFSFLVVAFCEQLHFQI